MNIRRLKLVGALATITLACTGQKSPRPRSVIPAPSTSQVASSPMLEDAGVDASDSLVTAYNDYIDAGTWVSLTIDVGGEPLDLEVQQRAWWSDALFVRTIRFENKTLFPPSCDGEPANSVDFCALEREHDSIGRKSSPFNGYRLKRQHVSGCGFEFIKPGAVKDVCGHQGSMLRNFSEKTTRDGQRDASGCERRRSEQTRKVGWKIAGLTRRLLPDSRLLLLFTSMFRSGSISRGEESSPIAGPASSFAVHTAPDCATGNIVDTLDREHR